MSCNSLRQTQTERHRVWSYFTIVEIQIPTLKLLDTLSDNDIMPYRKRFVILTCELEKPDNQDLKIELLSLKKSKLTFIKGLWRS